VLSEEFSRVAGRVPQLARIDDCGIEAPLPADVLVNQNLHANPRLYAGCSSDAKLLLGPTFALLRREFAPWRTWQRRVSPRVHRLLVTLGGSDDDNVAGKVIEALWMCSGLALDVRLVIGPAYAHRAKLAVACERLGVRVERGVTDMTPLLAWADVAITAAGSTTWEAAFFGLPAIVLTLADNQREIAASAHEAGLSINLGWHADVGPERIAEALTKLCDAPQLRQAMSQRGRRIVDGLGAGRVVEHLTRAAA
jgi:spore coat polysaccharide biosynthesis predicted glycosyltransferase SpsG